MTACFVSSPVAACRRISRAEHNISRRNISNNALKVLYRLHQEGYRSLLVGGSVRDLLLGQTPKDFDVVTDATPEQVKALFRNCRLIGRRFRLAHVLFGREVVEVATFRSSPRGKDDGYAEISGRILRDNVYGDIDQDAARRDFSINALYYDIADFAVLDYFDGVADLQARVVRSIGDPVVRYQEDPVRMLRALRFAAKLSFELEPSASQEIQKLGKLLQDIPASRLFDEVLKLLHSGHAVAVLRLLEKYQLLEYLFPAAASRLTDDDPYVRKLIELAARNTDLRVAEAKPVTPAFLYAVFLWSSVVDLSAAAIASGTPAVEALHSAADQCLLAQQACTSVPRRFSVAIREIWNLQESFKQPRDKVALRLMAQRRFRAAYDFFCLRAAAGEDLGELAQWWTEVQQRFPQAQSVATKSWVNTGEARNKGARSDAPLRRRRRRSRRLPVESGGAVSS